MSSPLELPRVRRMAGVFRVMLAALFVLILAAPLMAQPEQHHGGEANLVLPNLDTATFLGGFGGRTVLTAGLIISALGFLFGIVIYTRLRKLPG
jgi:K(+)-stimulated pyrophosphate-energized sodium pump